ncbi:MAG: serine hydrolase domain-containing protein [Pseudomonadota bacterium]
MPHYNGMLKVVRNFTAICLSLFALVGAALAQDFDLQATVDEAREEHSIVGMGAIIMHADGTYTIAVSGERVRGSGDPVQPDDAWHIGSNTKSMTALLYARLVEDGLASWGATIPDLFPDFADEIDSAWSEITIEDLFAHRSGLAQLSGGWFRSIRRDTKPVQEQRLETTLDFLRKPPAKAAGEYEYNNLGYVIAGSAIEGILTKGMGESFVWENAMERYVFSQLSSDTAGMTWGFGPPQAGIQGHRGALGSSLFLSPVGTGDSADNPSALGPAGTLHASLLAHARLSREYLLEDSTLIPIHVRQKLWAPYPAISSDSDYAMGWGVRRSDTYGTYYSHSGSNTMWLSDVRILPEYDLVVIINSNQVSDKTFAAHQDVLVTVLDHYRGISSKSD